MDNKEFAELKRYSNWMESLHKNVVNFHGGPNISLTEDNKMFIGFKPFRESLTGLKEGEIYLTIRCGLCGIYTSINQWLNGAWGAECLDGSTTIAYRELREDEKYEKYEDNIEYGM